MCQKEREINPLPGGINPPAKEKDEFWHITKKLETSYLLIIKHTASGKRPSDVFRDT